MRTLGLIGALVAALVATTARADDGESLASKLVATAHARRLGTSQHWLRLGHWHKNVGNAWEGEPDGEEFYLAKDGKFDPDAELDATIRALFATTRETKSDEHAACRFPARRAFVVRELGVDPTRMPRPACPRYDEYVARLRPSGASLVFSSYYLNNPASAFGHTFLRLHRAPEPGKRSAPRDLLDYGVDYSAVVDTENAIAYAFKGLVGLFPGTLKLMPYSVKVREYNDYESRDLWEYELGLSDAELATLVDHLWELGGTYFDYYYLSENCSYHVLASIEVAVDGAKLVDKIKSPVIPADTVKALLSQPGLVRGVHFRPSVRTQFRARLRELTSAQRDALEAVLDDPDAPMPASLSPRERIEVLDAAADLVDARYAKKIVDQLGSAPGALKQRLLARRAAIPVPSDELAIAPPLDKAPHAGHGSMRLGLAQGYASRDGALFELSHRLALHDLADPPNGFPDGSQIEFLDVHARGYPKRRAVELDDFSIVRVVSLTTQSRFERTLSWKIRAGATRPHDAGCDGCFAWLAQVGAGAAFELHSSTIAFATIDTELAAGPELRGIRDIALRAGVGPAAGARVRFGERGAWLTTGQLYYLPAADPTFTWRAESTLRLSIARDVAIGAGAKAEPRAREALLASWIYF